MSMENDCPKLIIVKKKPRSKNILCILKSSGAIRLSESSNDFIFKGKICPYIKHMANTSHNLKNNV